MNLLHRGKLLSDKTDVSRDMSIHEDGMTLVRKGKLRIRIETAQGNSIFINVKSSDTVGHLKSTIEQKRGKDA